MLLRRQFLTESTPVRRPMKLSRRTQIPCAEHRITRFAAGAQPYLLENIRGRFSLRELQKLAQTPHKLDLAVGNCAVCDLQVGMKKIISF